MIKLGIKPCVHSEFDDLEGVLDTHKLIKSPEELQHIERVEQLGPTHFLLYSQDADGGVEILGDLSWEALVSVGKSMLETATIFSPKHLTRNS